MKKTSIVIVSYNTLDYTRLCIESIRQYTTSGSYELIVVDNASRDGTVEWLREQSDIMSVFNKKNEGFPKGCNQGMERASGTEILLLNSDTIVTPHWLEQLLAALYSDDRVGAVSCVTNNCSNWQRVEAQYSSLDDMMAFAEQYNHTDTSKWEQRLVLVGFCYMFKREVYEKVGEMDEAFTPGNYEDDDYSLRIWQAGYRLLLCKDTFIHHFGGASFVQDEHPAKQQQKHEACLRLAAKNFVLFQKKWGVSAHYKELNPVLFKVEPEIPAGARVLEIDCGCGFDLAILSGRCPGIKIYGITADASEAKIANAVFSVQYCANIERDVFSCLDGRYDIVILTGSLQQFKNFAGFLSQMYHYVNDNGKIYMEDEIYTKKNAARPKTSIVIAVCNHLSYTQQCIMSVENCLKGQAYEIIVVDNASTDASGTWLKAQPAIRLIHNDKNRGIAAAFNNGIEAALGEEILFLHNDVVLTRGALEKMRQVLYSSSDIGAVGPVTNRTYYVYQYIEADNYSDFTGMQSFADQVGKSNEKQRQSLFLESFCLLVKRETVEQVGHFDEKFFPRYCEDIDYSLRLNQAGYNLMVVKNAYVHHEQGSLLNNGFEPAELQERNKEIFAEKWQGIRVGYSTCTKDMLLRYLDLQKPDLHVLDVGCACGGNLMRIRELNPSAQLFGIEICEGAASIAKCFGQIENMDIENTEHLEWKDTFDYIILGDILEHLYNPWQVLRKLYGFLKPDGAVVASIPNVMHISVLQHLLQGQWRYTDAGILDRTHLRFFTKSEIIAMMEGTGLRIAAMTYSEEPQSVEEAALKKELSLLTSIKVDKVSFDAYQWEVVAVKK
jgi:O-antigen biosynthesis protein